MIEMTDHERDAIMGMLSRSDADWETVVPALLPALAADQHLLRRIVSARMRLELGTIEYVKAEDAVRLALRVIESMGLELRPKGA